MKRCYRCGTEKPWGEFHRNRTRPDGHDQLCKPCRRDYIKDWTLRNPASQKTAYRKHALKKQFGITLDEYERMLAEQGGVCAICGSAETVGANHRQGVRRLNVDHCHESRKVRGLLCVNCNKGLGHFKDDPDRLAAAAMYLLRHEEPMSQVATVW